MKFIEEIVVEEFLPTVRSMLAEDLRERGLTQSEVASQLGISQSAVSKYAHGEVTRNDRIARDGRVREVVDRVGEGLASGDITRVQALVELEVLVRRLERGDLLSELHEAAMPELSGIDHSRIHDPNSTVRETEQVRSSVRRGVRTLTNRSGFAALIPNVGSNLVECLADAERVDDVAAVPGRIFDVMGRATVPGDPEFGVSEYVANVLLAAREGGADVRAAVNVRYDPGLLAELRAAGYQCLEFDPDGDVASAPDAVVESDADGGSESGTETVRHERDHRGEPAGVAAALAAAEDLDEVFVLYQTGGYGIEPITYVLGPDASTVAGVVQSLLSR